MLFLLFKNNKDASLLGNVYDKGGWEIIDLSIIDGQDDLVGHQVIAVEHTVVEGEHTTFDYKQILQLFAHPNSDVGQLKVAGGRDEKKDIADNLIAHQLDALWFESNQLDGVIDPRNQTFVHTFGQIDSITRACLLHCVAQCLVQARVPIFDCRPRVVNLKVFD